MKITLVHNPGAGYDEPSRVKIMKSLKKHDVEVRHISSDDKDLESLLVSNPDELVMVAGGDGTVHQIAKLLLDKAIPMAIIPIGTANNVALSLNDEKLTLDSSRWLQKEVVKIDVGEININGNSKIFFESIGMGALANMMHQYDIFKKLKKPEFESRLHKLRHIYNLMLKTLPDLTPSYYQISVDQENYSGSYLWVEVINMKYFGPHLKLTPDINSRDGMLDLLLIREDEKSLLQQYFTSLLEDADIEAKFRVVRGKKFSITTEANPLHVDDALLMNGNDTNSLPQFQLSIHAKPQALTLIKYPLAVS